MSALPIYIVVTSAIILITAFIVVIFKHKQKMKIVSAAVASTDPSAIKEIYQLIEACNAGKSRGFVLGRTNSKPQSNENYVSVPNNENKFPWAGMTFHFENNKGLHVSIEDSVNGQSQLNGEVLDPILVPSMEARPGQFINMYLPNRYLNSSDKLYNAVRNISARYPEQVLSYLLCPGKEEYDFEPTDQVRIGTGASWIRNRELIYCGECQEKMSFIMQLPGNSVDKEYFQNGVIYLFGCNAHPKIIKHIIQYS